jgi:hypothetical protein
MAQQRGAKRAAKVLTRKRKLEASKKETNAKRLARIAAGFGPAPEPEHDHDHDHEHEHEEEKKAKPKAKAKKAEG